MGPLTLIKRAPSAVAEVSPAVTIPHGGAARIRARGDGLARGLAHWNVRDAAHPAVAVAAAGVAGSSNYGERGGGRSSGQHDAMAAAR